MMSERTIKVLLIEDNRGDARLIQEMLKEAATTRFELTHVDRLATGLQQLDDESFDLVLLDLGLPDSHGLDTFTKTQTQAPDVPIVLLTGLDDEAFALEAVREGAQDYLVKGHVDSHLLTRAVRFAIERHRAEEALRERNRELMLLNRAIAAATSTLLDSGQAVTTWEAIHLSAVIDSTVNRYQSQAQSSGLTLTATPLPPDLPPVKGDQARLSQALVELVGNAVLFTPTGGQVTIDTGTVEQEGQLWVTIAVRDTGPGIPPEEQERIFERFYRGQLAEAGHVLGTGLGLSIAQEIMRAHGGRVTLESDGVPGQGSTFTLWLRGSR
jgi:signal transduction histidine kinase